MNTKAIARSTSILIVIAILVVATVAGYITLSPPSTKSTSTSATALLMSSSQSTSATSATSTTSIDSMATLIAQANAEGALTMYTTLNAALMSPLLGNFSQLYPSIKVQAITGTNPSIISRVLSEAGAGQNLCDIIPSEDFLDISQLYNNGYLLKYQPINARNLLDYSGSLLGHQEMTGYIYPISTEIAGVAYNNRLLSGSSIPTSWMAFTNPTFKGKLTMTDPSADIPTLELLVTLRSVMGNATWNTFMQALVADNPAFQSSGGVNAQGIAQGTYVIGTDLLQHIVTVGTQFGNDMSVAPVSPVFSLQFFSSIYYKAPHPHAAELFEEFLLSKAGQNIIVSAGNNFSTISGVAVPSYFPSQLTILPLVVLDNQQAAYWIQYLKTNFGIT